MKTKLILITGLFLFSGVTAEAQFLKRLKKKAEQAVERTVLNKTDEAVSKKTEETIDDATTKKNKNNKNAKEDNSTSESTNSALEHHTEAKKDFFKEDVVIQLFENKVQTQTQYFDKDEVAVKLEQDNEPRPGYIDSEGFFYGFNEKEGQYNKSSIIAIQSQGMMVPMMMLEAYKLPPEPFMAKLQKQQDQGVTPNPFNGIVEFAFIYEPENFRYEDFKESKQKINGETYTKFDFLNEPGYEGSYVLFDNQDRLAEIYTNKTTTEQSMDSFQMDMTPPGEGRLIYNYKPVDVKLPFAVEKKTAGQDMMGMVMGSFKKDKTAEDIDEDDYDTSNSKGMVKSAKNSLKNNKVTTDMLPESYDFDWQYKTIMVMESRKKDVIDMTFLLNVNANYQGSELVDRKTKDMGKMTMVFDTELNAMVMFIEGQGNQKMLQMYSVPEPKKGNKQEEFKIKELPSKTILGYNCKGLQLENDKYTVQVYHATNTPITLSNFFSFSGDKNMNLPDLDPRLAKQFSEGLIMEMLYTDKKKAKNNFSITAQSLEKKPTQLKKGDYKTMDFMSGAKMFKSEN